MKPRLVALAVAGVVVLAALSLVAVAAATGGFDAHRSVYQHTTTCTVPALGGSVVVVTLSDMSGGMMRGGGPMMGRMMRLRADHGSVPAGTVSFLAENVGSVNHELVVLPLPGGQVVGARPIAGSGQVDESGSVGEASTTCGEAGGEGIAPGSSSWVTLTLAPGRYELVCNLPGHYSSGMYTQLTVN